jgi:acyl carrier protein
MLEKLIDVLSKTLNVPTEQITIESNATNIQSWDSLAHMNVVFAIEDSFEIQFTDEELENSTSVKQLLEIISKNG